MTIGLECAHHLTGYQVGFSGTRVGDRVDLAFADQHGAEALLLGLADHGIQLPGADMLAARDKCGTFMNANGAFNAFWTVLRFWCLRLFLR